MKKIRYIVEYIALRILFFLFGLMPVDMASALGGFIGRTIGPRLATSRKALYNLEKSLPYLRPDERVQTIEKMWDNLGRIMAEYPHLSYIAKNRVAVENVDIVNNVSKKEGPAIFIGAHMGNWEITGATMLIQCGQALHFTYRAPNNPWVDKLLHKIRILGGKITGYPKSRAAARDIYRALKNNSFVGIFIDQKFNEGISVPFFNRPAMTNPAFVQLCQKFKCPLVPAQVVRLEGAHFKMIFHEPVPVLDTHETPLPVENVIETVHQLLETWITDRPGQWLWLHRRWHE